MDLPKRSPQHISESESFKIFSSKIPSNWIIREVTERDYGIDCYIELVNEKNELTGELVLIQLKSSKKVSWTKEGTYSLSKVNISTTNYWFKFKVPVFIFLVDIESQEVFFLQINHFIRQNFSTYIKQENFNYIFKKSLLFEGENGVSDFRSYYYFEYYREQYENEILFFLNNLNHYMDFLLEHEYRDFHLGIEIEDLISFESMLNNFTFLNKNLKINYQIPSIKEIKENSQKTFGNEYHYDIYEYDIAGLVPLFKKVFLSIIIKFKEIIYSEKDFWLITNGTLFNYVVNINETDIELRLNVE